MYNLCPSRRTLSPKSKYSFIRSDSFLCFLLQGRRKEEELKRKEEKKRKMKEEDLRRRREEEVKRRKEVVARVSKQPKIMSTKTSDQEESNGGRASAPRSKKFLNLFSSDNDYSSTGLLPLVLW